MKLQTTLSRVLMAMTVATIFIIGCKGGSGDGLIPVDESKANNEIITIKQARALQKNYLAHYAELGKMVKDSSYLKKDFNLPNAETFGRDAIAILLNTGADSIRVYYGIDSLGEMHLVLLPVDGKGKDMYRKLIGKKSTALKIPGISSAQAQDNGDGEAVENGQTCPPCTIDPDPMP
jgi:hypothetical protein